MSGVDELVEWLRARFNEDERLARAVQQPDDLRWRARHMAGEEAEGTVRWDVPGVAQPTHVDPLNKARMEHIAAWDPARVLREIDARQQLLDEHQDVNDGSCGTCVDGRWGYPTHGGSSPQRYPCRTLRLLALPYADRPGYRAEWRP